MCSNRAGTTPPGRRCKPSMRRHLVWLFALVTAIVVAAAAIASAADTGNNVSTVGLKVKPSKLSTKKFKPVKMIYNNTTLVKGDPGTPQQPTLFGSPSKEVDVS